MQWLFYNDCHRLFEITRSDCGCIFSYLICLFVSVKRCMLCFGIPGDDVVQCVPTKKGHQILFKGYTYVFKSRLQCGSEQWCCSFRQKTELPEWVVIYFMKSSDTEYRCNICEYVITANEKSLELLDHIKLNHKEVYDLHKDNPDSSVGFRIEFLHFNVVKNENEAESQTRDVIIGEVCEAITDNEIAKSITVGDTQDVVSEDSGQIDIMTKKKKRLKTICLETRKRSWVWKYFEKVSNIMYRCTFCNAILSIKGCNTNNLNRHMRTKHPRIFVLEMDGRKDDSDSTLDMESSLKEGLSENVISEAYISTEGVVSESPQKQRSWVWMYFTRISHSLAQCKLCERTICHGGNATGNMNRHLKMRHNKTGDRSMSGPYAWIWKVFDVGEEDFYTCKICQYQCTKLDDLDKSINSILNHLRIEHGVISGDQIITSSL